MSRTILIAAHADDESLFAAFLAQRHSAHIAVVYDEGREAELAGAADALSCSYSQGNVRKRASADEVEAMLIGLRDPTGQDDWDIVIAPDEEEFGHEEHNAVAKAAWQTFGDLEIIRYRTYSPRGTRSHGTPSLPGRPEHIARKLAALSCYHTQIEDVTTRPWFYDLLDMREWIV